MLCKYADLQELVCSLVAGGGAVTQHCETSHGSGHTAVAAALWTGRYINCSSVASEQVPHSCCCPVFYMWMSALQRSICGYKSPGMWT